MDAILSQKKLQVDRIFTTIPLEARTYQQVPEVVGVTQREMRKLSHFQSPSEVLVVMQLPAMDPVDTSHWSRVLYLDDVQDPGNVGSIIRIADWYGFDAVLRSEGSADYYGSKVVQSTMGSFVNVDMLTMSREDLVKMPDIQLVATSLQGQSHLDSLDVDRLICLIIGNEGQGISDYLSQQAHYNYLIRGAVTRSAESLNASIAAAIVCDKLFALTAKG